MMAIVCFAGAYLPAAHHISASKPAETGDSSWRLQQDDNAPSFEGQGKGSHKQHPSSVSSAWLKAEFAQWGHVDCLLVRCQHPYNQWGP